MIRVAVGTTQEAAFPEQVDCLIAPQPTGRVKVADADALDDSFEHPTEGTNPLGERSMKLFCAAPVFDRGAEGLERSAQPEVCHAGAGVRTAEGIAMRAAGVATTALRASAGRVAIFALRGAALADDAVATANPATMVSESAVAARRRRAGVVTEEVVMH